MCWIGEALKRLFQERGKFCSTAFHEVAKPLGRETQCLRDHRLRHERVQATADEGHQELISRDRRDLFPPGAFVDLLFHTLKRPSCGLPSLRRVKVIDEIRMSRRFANDVAEQIWVLGKPGVIGIDESLNLLVERNVGPQHLENAGNE